MTVMLSLSIYGQKVGIKTNVVHAAALTPNIAVEMGLNMNTTLEVYGAYNGFDLKEDKKWKHWIVQPEFRWWFCERFNGSYLGVHLHGGEFNVGGTGPFTAIKNNRYDGYFYGAGISYGYQWMISKRWAFELGVGAGYARFEYDRYRCHECSPKTGSGHYNYFGPTKALISFVLFLW